MWRRVSAWIGCFGLFLSFGWSVSPAFGELPGRSPELVAETLENGILIVASAGRDEEYDVRVDFPALARLDHGGSDAAAELSRRLFVEHLARGLAMARMEYAADYFVEGKGASWNSATPDGFEAGMAALARALQGPLDLPSLVQQTRARALSWNGFETSWIRARGDAAVLWAGVRGGFEFTTREDGASNEALALGDVRSSEVQHVLEQWHEPSRIVVLVDSVRDASQAVAVAARALEKIENRNFAVPLRDLALEPEDRWAVSGPEWKGKNGPFSSLSLDWPVEEPGDLAALAVLRMLPFDRGIEAHSVIAVPECQAFFALDMPAGARPLSEMIDSMRLGVDERVLFLLRQPILFRKALLTFQSWSVRCADWGVLDEPWPSSLSSADDETQARAVLEILDTLEEQLGEAKQRWLHVVDAAGEFPDREGEVLRRATLNERDARALDALAKVDGITPAAQRLAAVDAALRIQPLRALLHQLRAETLHEMGRLTEARTSVARALRINPELALARVLEARLVWEGGGQTEQALASLRQVLHLDETDVPALLLRAEIRLSLGQHDAARADYERAGAFAPLDDETHRVLATLLLEEFADPWAALEAAAKAVFASPGNEASGILLARAFRGVELRRDALEIAARAAQRGHLSEEEAAEEGESIRKYRLYLLAWSLLHRGDAPEHAEWLARDGAERYPDYQRFPVVVSEALDARGQEEAALEYLESVLSVHENFPLVWKALGRARAGAGDFDAARQAFDRCTKNWRTEVSCMYGKAHTLRQLGEKDEALALLEKHAEENPRSYRAQLALAHFILDKVEDPVGAEGAFRRVLELRPDEADALCNLGDSVQRQGRYEEARRLYLRATEISPAYVACWAHLGRLLDEELGESEAALAAYRRGLAFRSDDRSLRRGVIRALFEIGREDEARELLEEYIETDEPGAWHFRRLGLYLKSAGRFDIALEVLRRERELAKKKAWPDYRVGLVLSGLGRHEEAARTLDEALVLDPEFEQAAAALVKELLTLGRIDEARERLPRWLAASPESGRLRAAWAATLRADGEDELGREACLEMLEDRSGADASALTLNDTAWYVATVCGKGDRELLERARTIAERAVELSSRRKASYLDTLGEVLLGLGERDAAVALLDEALAIDGGDRPFFRRRRAEFAAHGR